MDAHRRSDFASIAGAMCSRRGILAGLLVTLSAPILVRAKDKKDGPETRSKKHIVLCHKGKQTLHVAAAAGEAHLAHGDTLGSCETPPTQTAVPPTEEPTPTPVLPTPGPTQTPPLPSG